MEDELEQRAADYLSSVLGFNGERIDPVLGGYHLGNGYRLYSPSLRRFTSPDSMSPFGKGGINPYAYCEGDPINSTDPTGRLKASLFRSVGDLLFGVVIDDPELIADAALRDEEGHLGARSVRQTAARATRPRTSSVSLEAERAARPRTAREDRAIRAKSYIEDPNNFEHELFGSNIIESRDKNNKSSFLNKYKPKKWTFIDNERIGNPPYHASDIAGYQYNIISRNNNFFGIMPQRIKRSKVSNESTLKNTKNLESESLFDKFFNDTPNGKSTQYILDDFKLKAKNVMRKDFTHESTEPYTDFLIHISI